MLRGCDKAAWYLASTSSLAYYVNMTRPWARICQLSYETVQRLWFYVDLFLPHPHYECVFKWNVYAEFICMFLFSGKLHVIFVFKRKISSKQQISFLKLWFKSYTSLRHETENSWVIVSFLSVFQLFTNRKLVTLHHPHIVRRRNSFVVSKTQFFIHQVYSCSLVSFASVSHLLTEELHFLKSRIKVTWPEYDHLILVDFLSYCTDAIHWWWQVYKSMAWSFSW